MPVVRSSPLGRLSAPAGVRGNGGKVTVGPDSLHFVPARRGDPITVPYDEISEVEVARTPLISATRAWVRTVDGREMLFTITAPVAAVIEALGSGSMARPSQS